MWTDNKVMCRLYCCMYDERVRPYFVSKDDVMTRPELDARNNEDRPLTVWEKIAHLFNDREITFELPCNPNLHHAFAEPMILNFDSMPGEITPDDCKKRLADSRAKLMRVISRWELSGNGFGQRTELDEEFGHMEEEQLEDGDNRAKFLDGIGKEHLLILWDLGDKEGVLSKFLNRLSAEVGVDPDNIPTNTAAVQNPRRLTAEQQQASGFRQSLANSMASMSMTALYMELRECETEARKLKQITFECTTAGSVDFYEACFAQQEERILELKEEIKRCKHRRLN
jgi:hypothetical protein